MKLGYYLFFIVFLVSCKTQYSVSTELTYQRVADTEGTVDEDLEQMIEPYREQFEAVMNEEIGILEVDLVKERPESNMGNWLADMFYEEVQKLLDEPIDFAVQNHGGLRINSLAAGPITTGEIYELMPFDNLVVVLETDSSGVMSFIHHIAEGKGWPISKGLSFKISDKRATDVMLHGQPLSNERTYRFAVPDYVAGGGSGSKMLIGMKRTDFGVFVRDTFIQNIKDDTAKGIVQRPEKEGRIINLDHE